MRTPRLLPFALVLGLSLLAVLGLSSFRSMPVNLLPSLNYPLINVVTHYPAGTAQDVELLVTRPIESAIQGLQQLRRVRSVSTAGFSEVTIEFEWGVDVLAARELVTSALAQAGSLLPPGAVPRMENLGTSLSQVSTYTLSGAEPVALRSWAEYTLAPALSGLPGVARVEVMGGGIEALRIDLDPSVLRARGLSSADVVKAIRGANVLATGGFVEQYGRELLVSSRALVAGVDEVRSVLLGRSADGTPLLLGDVARVYRGALPERYEISDGRRPAVAFQIQKQPQASTLEVSAAVDAALAGLHPPGDAQIRKFYDQAEIIGLAYRNMRNQLLSGALLAVLTLFFVLGRNRTTWIVTLTMPLTVLGTFAVMHLAGLSIDLMTLAAITVTIGMINDDAVLVLENIFRHRQMGKSPGAAARDGTREILGADVAGTLTVVAAFVPLAFLSGLAGRLFLPFGLTFGILLLFSLVLSLTVIPVAAARWLPPGGAAFDLGDTVGTRWIEGVARGNRRLLDLLLRHRGLTIGGGALVTTAFLALLALNPTRFLPLLDEESLLVSYQLAPGTNLTESSRVGDRLDALALAQPGVDAVFRRTGSPESTTFLEGPDAGELLLRLAPGPRRDSEGLRQNLERRLADLPGILTRVNEPTTEKIDESLSGLPALFGITLLGTDLTELHRAAARVEDLTRATPGFGNVINNTKVPVDTLDVQIDRAACARLGVVPQELAEAARTAIQGEDVSQTPVEGRILHVFVRYAGDFRRRASDLELVLVPAVGGTQVPLGQVAHVVPGTSYPSVEHLFGSRALTLTAEIDGNPYLALSRLTAGIAKLGLPAGIRVEYTGEFRELLRTMGQILLILMAAALLVYGILAVALGNLLDPALVMVKLPMDFMGAAVALFLTRQTLDMTVLIGFVTLVGVSVNNALVLLAFAGQLRAKGLTAVEAIHQAVEVRIRPMLLTQLISVLALLPAALGLGKGPQLLQPLGVMLFGGLTAGAFLTLNVVPVLYVAVERWRRPPAAPEAAT